MSPSNLTTLSALKSYRRFQDKIAVHTEEKLDFAVQRQKQTNWCWAAVSASVAAFYNSKTPWTQCKVATAVTGTGCCGPTGAQPPCNVPNYLERALSTVGHYRGRKVGTITYSSVKNQIASDNPIGVRVEWPNGDGHFVAIFGWRETSDGRQYIWVGDPNKGLREILLSDLRTGYGEDDGKWTHSYFSCHASVGATIKTPVVKSVETIGP